MVNFRNLEFDLSPDGVLVVTMNRPPVNAVNQDMYIELERFFSDPDQAGDNVRAIVLTGAGPHFSAGNDLGEFATMTPENGTERMWRVRRAFFAIQDCVVPVIGAVHGSALGTGLAIAASCDFLVAAKDAKFGLPELSVGVMGGARHLARLAPEPLVRRLFFTSDPISAEELASCGSAIVLCEKSALLEKARHYASRIARLSPTAVRLGKQVLGRVESMELKTGYEFEQGFTVTMSGHPDSKEALKAFAERRPAKFLPLSS